MAAHAVVAHVVNILICRRHLRKKKWVSPAKRHEASTPCVVGTSRVNRRVAVHARVRVEDLIRRGVADLCAWHVEVFERHRNRTEQGDGNDRKREH